MNITPRTTQPLWCALLAVLASSIPVSTLLSQVPAQTSEPEEEVIRLTPFEVSAEETQGYQATSTLAGNRLRTRIEDVGSAISVYTREFLKDIVATDNQSLLAYALNTEVGGPRGNFVGGNSFGLENDNLQRPNSNTRIRGLATADNTRNFYRSDTSWDGYNIERVEVQRGANSILFGIGSPGGIVNATPIEARLRKNSGELQARVDQFGSFRTNLDYNYVVARDKLAIRVALLSDQKKFRQKPAFEDDERGYVTATWAPSTMNKGESTLRIRGNYEHGRTRSNRPRMIAPIDTISTFFAAPGTSGFEGEFANAGNWGFGGMPVNQIDDAVRITGNPWYGQTFEAQAPRFIYGGGIAEPTRVIETFANSRGGWMPITQGGNIVDVVRNDGTRRGNGSVGIGQVEGNIRGTMQRLLWGKNRAAAEARLKYQGFWKDSSLTDTRYYDFFNNLTDGDTKREGRDWDSFEVDLAHSFFNDKLGYNVSYFKEQVDETFYSNLGSVEVPTITVDIGALDRQATPDRRVPNAAAGQAFIRHQFGHIGSSETERDREAKRLQAFAKLDASDFGESTLLRMLGVHDFVALAQNQTFEQYGRALQAGNWMPDYYVARNTNNTFLNPPPGARVADLNRIGGVNPEGASGDVYLVPSGPNLTGLQPMSSLQIPSGSYTIRGFDASPLPGFTREAALLPWVNPSNNQTSVQANNPDNYVGWRDIGSYRFVSVYDGEAEREYLTRSRSVFSEDIDSIAGVWTGRLWDGNIVGMYGWRQDKVEETFRNHSYTSATDGGVFNPDRSNRTIRSTTVESKNWSAKLNVTGALQQITGMGRGLPFDVHLLYSEGEVQKPDPTRVDLFGRTLANSVGTTKDASAMFVAKDGRWTFRVTKYETDVKDTASTATLNREVWRLIQVLEQGALRAGFIETDSQNYTSPDLPLSAGAIAGGFSTEAEYRRKVVAPAFRAMERTLYEDYPLTRAFYASGSYSAQVPFVPGQQVQPFVKFPDGAVLVEDQLSEGWEFEFTASPRRNWNVAVNASRSIAIRDNVPGSELGAVFDLIGTSMRGPAGDLRIWGAQGGQFVGWINPLLGELAVARALNGTAQPEIRKWKANAISNYTFEGGGLRGIGVGGAYRYEDSQIIGFQPTQNSVTGEVGVDKSIVFRDDPRHTFDLWLSYQRPLRRNVGWKIQLNVQNAFGKNEVVPLHRNPDGTFGQMGIREGRSWSVTNTFTF